MRTSLLFTLTGPDRVGIVEEVTRALLDLGGNVESSRMARLGGEFAMLLLVSMPSENVEGLEPAFVRLTEQGYQLSARATEPVESVGRTYRVEVRGADHEGIIHEIAGGLAVSGVNIESVDTGVEQASISGAPLFTMSAVVAVPDSVDAGWMDALRDAGQASNVDVEIAEL